MKHSLQFAVWILILALFAGVPATAMTVAEITASAKNATAERFPDADSVLVYDLEEITYQPDGLGTGTDDFYQKVLNESGRKQLRELSFRYNSTYEKLEVLTVEIIRPDGKIVKIDPASGRETIDASQMGSNIYDPANKVFTIAVPGLEIGDMLHVKSRETTLKARIPGQWSGYNVLQADVPFLYYEVRINAPEDLPRIFDRFYRCDKARGRESGSSGLGLTIAKNIIEIMGGQITVSSVKGQGTTFKIVLY